MYHIQNNEDAESEDEDDDEWDNDDSQESDSSTTNNREIDLSQLLAPAEDYLDDEDDATAGDPWPLRQGGSNQGKGSDALSPLYGSQPD